MTPRAQAEPRNPAVDDSRDDHHSTQFFSEFASETGLQGFAGFEATARWFPFVTVVFEQHYTTSSERRLDRHGEIHPRLPYLVYRRQIEPGVLPVIAALRRC